MKLKAMITMCSTVIICILTGCQLAQENTGTNEYEDRLVGVLITTEYIDLFDFEAYLGDNLSGVSGDEVIVD